MNPEADCIVQVVDLRAAPAVVWRALTDHEAFGTWFRVALEGPFRLGGVTRGRTTYPGYEGLRWRALVTRMEPLTVFAFRWPLEDDDPEQPLERLLLTTLTFTLEARGEGTRLTLTECGFAALPEPQRSEFRARNAEGWAIQAQHITTFVDG
ncbi:MAG: SRPBCC domain-containing protein [Pseudomonadales bacterium]|jgi:uncharacterized protein YndB with AHSA1/START domain|nr:SRPBCC domain-containing protein [Pseudomonadales bacterium]